MKSQEENFIEFYEEKLRLENTKQKTYKWGNLFKNFGKRIGMEFITHDVYSPYPDSFSFTLDDEDLKYLYEKYKPVAEQKRCNRILNKIKVTEANIKTYQEAREVLLKQKCG
jgi:hypothetical protein